MFVYVLDFCFRKDLYCMVVIIVRNVVIKRLRLNGIQVKLSVVVMDMSVVVKWGRVCSIGLIIVRKYSGIVKLSVYELGIVFLFKVLIIVNLY